ncbi:autotransporter outer membrane beta-barrel domain-containing protein [Pseudomonas putida]|uniref:Autotransporter outer membrane beta-barrel domain-containing protein n=1 Tax=Pseudomonas putida TaxID=303 RepID=A0A2Z4RE05_PSEPU|nr:autotransporter outer membrane beta-barrel domain-containing protein [Pseudomonas putida]AWY39323.1 autotransporter outer membrane beta-barrel domain-containing protein [Pseudomonas putida]
MKFSSDWPQYGYCVLIALLLLLVGWSHPAHAACTLTPTAGNDNFVCDSGTSGPLTDLAGNNTLSFPVNGTGVINGAVRFGAGNDIVTMDSGQIVGTLNQGDGANNLTISAGQITGAVSQGSGIDNFTMTGGTIQSLAQGDSRDFFRMTGGRIIGAFEDGDTAVMTGGRIGRVDMKLDNNLFDMSGGAIDSNLVTGFGRDTIILSGGTIGGFISVSGGNDSVTVTGGEVAGEIRMSAGNDTFVWDGGGILHSRVLLEGDNDTATLRNLSETILAQTPSIDGGTGIDVLTFDRTTTSVPGRYVNFETVNLNNASQLDLGSGNLVLGDSASGTGVFNIDGSSTLTSQQGSVAPFTAGQAATLNNAGIIDLTTGNSRTNDTLTVQGNYAGSGGQLRVQSVLGDDSSPSDKLVVNNGKLTGTTTIDVTNLNGAGAATLQNGIQVVQAQGTATSDAGAFTLKAPLSAGAFDYVLYKGGVTPGSENSWYLRSSVVAPPLVPVTAANPDPALPPQVVLVPLVATPAAAVGSPPLPTPQPGAAPIPLYRPEVPNWAVLPPAAGLLALQTLGTFHERQGDQRLLTEKGAFGAGWGRIYGKNFDQTWAGTVQPKLDGSIKGFQVGNDLYSQETSGGHSQRTGVFVGQSRLKGDVDGFNEGFEDRRAGKVELRGSSLGAYWTLTDPKGWYFDTVAMYTWLDGDSHSDRGLKIDNKGHVVTLSAEGGYQFPLAGDWVIEPQAQIIHQQVKLDSQDDGISRVSFNSDPAVTGRLGARFKGRYTLAGLPAEPYLRANLWHTLSGTDTVTFANRTDIDTEQRASWADLGVGINLTVARNVSLYANVDYSRNIDSNQQRATAGNLGVRISW